MASSSPRTSQVPGVVKEQGVENVDAVMSSALASFAVATTKGGALLSILGGKSQIGHETASHLESSLTPAILLRTLSEGFESSAVALEGRFRGWFGDETPFHSSNAVGDVG